jgi:hypothetical protein
MGSVGRRGPRRERTLATALDLGADEMIVYDGCLAEAAATAGLRITSPGR